MSRIADIDFQSESLGPPPPVCQECGLPMHYDYTLDDWDCFRCHWLSTVVPDDESRVIMADIPETVV